LIQIKAATGPEGDFLIISLKSAAKEANQRHKGNDGLI
jgi:hypothetical protein